MKILPHALLVAAWFVPALAAQTPPTSPKAPEPKPPSKELAALLRYKPKPTRSAPAGRRVIAATRSGGAAPVKLVALAPAAGGITAIAQPRLWWWQSAATAGGELEFVLTRMEPRPQTVIEVKLGPMPAGYNAIDLSSSAINPTKAALAPGVGYQWTLGCFSGPRKESVFVRMSRAADPTLAKLLVTEPGSPATVSALSDAGNWYELFDIIGFPAGRDPQNAPLTALRADLLKQIGLDQDLKP
jgi:Domain of Unknown Function (DUF928)